MPESFAFQPMAGLFKIMLRQNLTGGGLLIFKN